MSLLNSQFSEFSTLRDGSGISRSNSWNCSKNGRLKSKSRPYSNGSNFSLYQWFFSQTLCGEFGAKIEIMSWPVTSHFL